MKTYFINSTKKIIIKLFLIPIIVSVFPSYIYGVTPLEINVSEDAYVRNGSSYASVNYGQEKLLVLKGDPGVGYTREVFLKFELKDIDINSYNTVQLKLRASHANRDADKVIWYAKSVSSNTWTEKTITWNNKPTVSDIVGSAVGVKVDESAYLDITQYIKDELQKGKTTFSFHISTSTVETGVYDAQLYSKEQDDPSKYAKIIFSKKEQTLDDIFDLITEAIQNKNKDVNIDAVDLKTKQYINSVNENGSFSDIPYTDKSQTNWPPIAHLDRLKSVVVSYTTEGSEYYEKEEIYDAIVKMLTYWQSANPLSENWYMQQIGCPQRMGVMLLLLRSGKKPLPFTLETNLINRMRDLGGDPVRKDGVSQGIGANKIDVATHWVYRGCLNREQGVLEKGITQVYYPITFTTEEGLQHDYSYQQHGAQLYIGGYGNVILQGVCNVAIPLIGTPYALSQEKFNTLSDFARKTYLAVIRGKNFLYNVSGRSLSRPNSLGQSGFASLAAQLAILDPENAEEYLAAKDRLEETQPASYKVPARNTTFWRSDYVLHQRQGFTADIRMVSTRTLRNENGNNENIKGYFLSDGAMDIAVDGDEYVDIFPVWDWARIPGTTTPALTTIPRPTAWGTSGSSTFAGGVSDGVYGVTAYHMYDNTATVNTEAKKSWFLFDNEIVCLGAGIKSTSTMTVSTTLNQSLLSGDVTIIRKNGDNEVLSKGSHSYTDANQLAWVLHNKVGYYFPEGGNVNLTNNQQSGSWKSINTPQSADIVYKDVFKLWLNHELKPVNKDYAYVIVPNVNTPALVEGYDTDNIEIIVNNEVLQAVRNKALDMIGIVFYIPSEFTYGDISIEATEPCALIIKNIEKEEVSVSVADPSCSLTSLSLITKLPGIDGVKELVCDLPEGKEYAGSSKSFVINEETPEYVPVVDPNIYVDVREDTYAYGGGVNTNYGTETMLVVKTDNDPAFSRESFLKFDISGVDFSKAKEIVLMLGVAEGDTDYLNNTMHITECNTTWGEGTLTWNTRPGIVGSKIASAKAVAIGGVLEFDIKDYVLKKAEANSTTLSFKLNNTYTGAVAKTRISFHSKESLLKKRHPKIKIIPQDDVAIPGVTEEASALKVYPNPVIKGELIHVDFNENMNEVYIRDLLGKVLIQTKEKSISTDLFSSGIYILSTENQEKGTIQNIKLIVR